jgi:hypothetical protein
VRHLPLYLSVACDRWRCQPCTRQSDGSPPRCHQELAVGLQFPGAPDSLVLSAGRSASDNTFLHVLDFAWYLLFFTYGLRNVFFKVLLPQCLSPGHFSILWTTNTNTSKHISPHVILIIKHQNHLAKWPRVHFPYKGNVRSWRQGWWSSRRLAWPISRGCRYVLVHAEPWRRIGFCSTTSVVPCN